MANAGERAIQISERCHRPLALEQTKLTALIELFRSLWRLPRKLRRIVDNARLSDEAIDAALERGRIADVTEPRATSVRYDPQTDRIIVELRDGSRLAFSPRRAQGLESATAEELANVKVLGGGYGLHWESLDVDFSVPGLAAGILGTRAYMARTADRSGSDGTDGK